jgi:putative ABC transport system substrate-binding protein
MKRRDFITLLAAAPAAAWPFPARAAAPMRRVGVLLLFAPDDPEARVRVGALGAALTELGWRDGENVRIEYRFASGKFDRMREFVKEMAALPADVVVTNSLQPVLAVWQETRPIPIVLAMVPDPVEIGLVNSLSNPDENITGFTTFEYSILGKWLELTKAIAPRITRAGLIFNPDAYSRPLAQRDVYWSYWLRELEAVAPSFGLTPLPLPVRDIAELERAVAALADDHAGALVISPDSFTVGNHPRIVAMTRAHRLPGCFPYSYFAAEGGLMSYGPNGADTFRRAASYVDRILRGAKPSELPIQRPTKLELVLNLKTAKEFGLEVPRTLLVRADKVIE